MPQCLRYAIARRETHESNTARIAASSCSYGSAGKAVPVSSTIEARRSPGVASSGSVSTSPPSTMWPNSRMKRTWVFRAKPALPHSSARPSSTSSLIPRSRIVSIIPGMLTGGTRADRDEERRGRIPEAAAGLALERGDALEHARPELLVEAATAGVVAPALVDGEHERGRHRQAERAHARDAGALAADDLGVERNGAVEDDDPLGDAGHGCSSRSRPSIRSRSSCSSNQTVW